MSCDHSVVLELCCLILHNFHLYFTVIKSHAKYSFDCSYPNISAVLVLCAKI